MSNAQRAALKQKTRKTDRDIGLSEEQVSDVTLSTFSALDQENAAPRARSRRLMPGGGCGGGCGCAQGCGSS